MPDVSWRTNPPRLKNFWLPLSESRGTSRSVLVSCCETRILSPNISIRAGKDCLAGGRFTGVDAFPLDTSLWLVKGDYAKSSLGLFLDSQFCCAIFCPLHTHKAALLRNKLFELFVTIGVMGILCSELNRSLQERLLHFL